MPKKKVYIIAEIGINHDGKLNKVLSLIRLAKKAGASAVKFQMFKPESMSRKESVTKYKIFKNKPKLTLFEMWNKLKVKKEWLKKIKILCRKEKIDFGFSIFDEYSLNIVKSLKPNFLKIASSDINDIYLVKKIIETKIRLIVSTGVSNLNEIKNVSKILKGYNFSLLHCVSLYPTEYKRVNLRRMIKLKKINSNIGFSDHTKGPIASIKAIEMGAKIIEKHFTLDKSSDGPDHICSADFKDLNLICEYSKFNSVVAGNDKIEPSCNNVVIFGVSRDLV